MVPRLTDVPSVFRFASGYRAVRRETRRHGRGRSAMGVMTSASPVNATTVSAQSVSGNVMRWPDELESVQSVPSGQYDGVTLTRMSSGDVAPTAVGFVTQSAPSSPPMRRPWAATTAPPRSVRPTTRRTPAKNQKNAQLRGARRPSLPPMTTSRTHRWRGCDSSCRPMTERQPVGALSVSRTGAVVRVARPIVSSVTDQEWRTPSLAASTDPYRATSARSGLISRAGVRSRG